MQNRANLSNALLNEEHRAVRLFLYLFYTVTIGYECILSYVFPNFSVSFGSPSYLGWWKYAIFAAILPVALYLLRWNQPKAVKYMYFVVFTLTNIIDEILIYSGNHLDYQSGNAMEMFMVLFSPIFVNRRYYLFVALGTMLKYIIVGISIQAPQVIIPTILVAILSIIALFLLNRFKAYVKAIEGAYDHQMAAIVKGIVTILELKDPYTRGHSERVAGYSLLLAQALNRLSQEDLKTFYYACLLHDVGKVNMPDNILMKTSRLTSEEYEIVKTHPEVGADAIKDIQGMEPFVDVVRHHHERWDGTGYPGKLCGPQIPLTARIAAIADAFDAMTSSRSYRPALPPEEAFRRIIEGEGTQFDPSLVEIFKKIYPSWLEFLDKHHRSHSPMTSM